MVPWWSRASWKVALRRGWGCPLWTSAKSNRMAAVVSRFSISYQQYTVTATEECCTNYSIFQSTSHNADNEVHTHRWRRSANVDRNKAWKNPQRERIDYGNGKNPPWYSSIRQGSGTTDAKGSWKRRAARLSGQRIRLSGTWRFPWSWKTVY